MNRLLLGLAVVLTAQISFGQYHYPTSKTVDVSDTYWGQTVSDPYRWIEDIKNPEVVSWFRTEAEFTNSQLAMIPGQDALIKELRDLDTKIATRYWPIAKAGGRYFYTKRLAGEQVAKLYYRQGAMGSEILLFDPQKYVEGKTMDFSSDVSNDGTRVLLNLSEAGSEVGDIRIIDVASLKMLDDVVPHSSGGFVGGSNSEIMFTEMKNYDVHDPEFALNTPWKLHVIGTSTASDVVVASSKKDPELNISPSDYPVVSVSKRSSYMVLGKYSVENNLTLYYAPKSDLKNTHIVWQALSSPTDEVRGFWLSGNDVFFLTTKGSPKFKIIKTDLRHPDLAKATTLIEGNDEWKLSDAEMAQTKDYLIVTKSKNDLVTKVVAYDIRTGQIADIDVPLKGNIHSLGISQDDNEIVLSNTGWSVPTDLYSYDVANRQLSNGVFHMAPGYTGLQNIVAEELEVRSHDGAMVPLSIVYDKTKLKKDGSNTCFMMGYGAYGLSPYLPGFNGQLLPLINRGVIIAFSHVRGGGEKGNEWYLAGKKATKPNTWKDLNASAEYLIKNKYTSAEKLGITGASAGGILIGRAITERPDLYKVAIPKVGALNTMRMEFTPNGPVNVPEFGTVKDDDEFKALLEMDAYQHIRKGTKYPAQLITTGFNDPRVDSFIPAKFAARMQAENGSDRPVFLYVDYAAGHFGGSTVDERFKQTAREYAFLLWQTGNREFQPSK